MRIDVTMTLEELQYIDLTSKVAVVIDLFRFTTTALTVLRLGAQGVMAVTEPEQAFAVRNQSPGSVLLAGEREARKIAGFDLGNSPLEVSREIVANKMVVSTTTNGTRAVNLCQKAQVMLLGCLRNVSATAQFLQAQERDVVLVPAGLGGRFSLEDTWCAGKLASMLSGQMTDGAKTAVSLAASLPVTELPTSDHGRILQKLGLQKDISFCLDIDAETIVVSVDTNSLIAKVVTENTTFLE